MIDKVNETTDQTTERHRDDALKKALSTPPQPKHESAAESKKKSKDKRWECLRLCLKTFTHCLGERCFTNPPISKAFAKYIA